jgi:hypothetical protein
VFAVRGWEFWVREIVDEALGTYELTSRMDPMQLAQSRDRITQYLDKLMSAGQADPHQLTEYARAYLREMHEGRDPRFTGC